MGLQPRLVRAVMDMPTLWKVSPDVITHFQVDVELWEKIGLCIHPVNIIRWKPDMKEYWSVSHFHSGRFLSEKFDTREEAIQFMMNVRKDVLSDWRMSYEQFQARKDFNVIQQKIISMRKEGHYESNIQTRKGKTSYQTRTRV